MNYETFIAGNTGDCVYFFDLRGDEHIVRIGYASDISSRAAQHESVGQELLAVLPASQDYEDRLHRHFTSLGATAGIKKSKSCYVGDIVWDYVEWLVRRGYAVTSIDDLRHTPPLPWEVIDPANVSTHWDDGRQRSLWKPARRERVKLAADAAYHASMSDEWFTPANILESARAVMGAIDLDPASCPKANETVRARTFYSQRVDGLNHPWTGRVWMNPPYSRLAPLFAEKLLAGLSSGAIPEAIALFNGNAMSSMWFAPIYASSSALLVTRGRLRFLPGDPNQPFSSPATGSVIVYFGPNVGRFRDEFAKHGTVLSVLAPQLFQEATT